MTNTKELRSYAFPYCLQPETSCHDALWKFDNTANQGLCLACHTTCCWPRLHCHKSALLLWLLHQL